MDLERRDVVDQLPDRKLDTTARWLRAQTEIEAISRDRCSLYALAAAQGSPQARQVADRFHQIQNLRDVIERQLSRGPTRMVARPAPGAQSPATPPIDDLRPSRLSAAAIHRNADRDARRAVRVAQFVRVKDDGLYLAFRVEVVRHGSPRTAAGIAGAPDTGRQAEEVYRPVVPAAASNSASSAVVGTKMAASSTCSFIVRRVSTVTPATEQTALSELGHYRLLMPRRMASGVISRS